MGILKKYLMESLPVKRYLLSAGNNASMKFPKYALGLGALLLAHVLVKNKVGRRVLSDLYKIGFSSEISTSPLPPQPKDKPNLPTLIIDIEDVLLIKKWSFSILGYEYKIHPESEVFLFHLSHEYEIVSVSSMPNEIADEMLAALDPYGCIKYRMHIPNTNSLKVSELNRNMDRLLRIRNKEVSGNDLSVGKWNGMDGSTDLMSLLDFLLNLKQLETDDFRDTLKTYRHKPFFDTYNEARKSIYPLKRQYILFKNPNAVNEHISTLNKSRIEEYQIAKAYIENQMRIEKIRKDT